MDRFAKYFVISSFIYLLAGSFLGLLMIFNRGDWKGLEYLLIPSHTHLQLIGWVSMLIFGVAYHILPRFMGRLIYSRKLAWLHFAFAQAGIIGMVVFFFLNRLQEGEWLTALKISGTLMFLSIVLFAFNMLKTLLGRRDDA